MVPESTANFSTRPGVVAVPVEDLGPDQVAVARPAGRTTGLVREFADAAGTLLPDQGTGGPPGGQPA